MALATSWNTTRFAVKHTVAAAIVTAGTGLFAGVSWLTMYLWASHEPTAAVSRRSRFRRRCSGRARRRGAASSVLVLPPITSARRSCCASERACASGGRCRSAALLAVVGVGTRDGHHQLGRERRDAVRIAQHSCSPRQSAGGSARRVLVGSAVDRLAAAIERPRRRARIWPSRFAALSTRPELSRSRTARAQEPCTIPDQGVTSRSRTARHRARHRRRRRSTAWFEAACAPSPVGARPGVGDDSARWSTPMASATDPSRSACCCRSTNRSSALEVPPPSKARCSGRLKVRSA